MRRPYTLFFLLVLLGPCLNAAPVLTLEDAVTLAVEHNADLQKQALDLADKARRKDAAVWNWALPSVSLSGGISNSHPIAPAGDASSSWNAGGSVGLSFNAAIPSRIALAETQYKASDLTFTQARQTLIKTVSVTFYNLLAEKENIEILKNNLELLKNQYEQTEQNYQRGLAPELDLLNAQYSYQVAMPELRNAVSDYDRHVTDYLVAVLGVDPGEYRGVAFAGSIEILPLALPSGEALAAAYAEQNTTVTAQILAASQSELNAKISAVSSLAPSLSLSESVRVNSPAGGFAGSPAASGTFSLTLSIPISSFVPGSSSALDISAARDTAALAQSALETTRKKAVEDIKQKVDDLLRAGESIESRQFSYRISLRAYELSGEGYTRGLVSATDLQESRQRMISAQQAVLQAEVSYLSTVYELALALNLDISELYERYAQPSIPLEGGAS